MRLRIGCICLICLCLALPSLESMAQDEPSSLEQAKALYLEGKEHFQNHRYGEAMAAFTESYNLSSRPDLLYNLAVTSERLADSERAIAFYELYLEELPDSPDVEIVRSKIAELKKPTHDKSNETAQSPNKPDHNFQGGAVAVRHEGIRAIDGDLGREATTTPVFNRIFPAILLSSGALLLSSGAITAITVHNKFKGLESNCAPNCTDEEIASVKRMAIATDLQLGVGIIAAGIGSILLVLKNRRSSGGRFSALQTHLMVGSNGGGCMIRGGF